MGAFASIVILCVLFCAETPIPISQPLCGRRKHVEPMAIARRTERCRLDQQGVDGRLRWWERSRRRASSSKTPSTWKPSRT